MAAAPRRPVAATSIVSAVETRSCQGHSIGCHSIPRARAIEPWKKPIAPHAIPARRPQVALADGLARTLALRLHRRGEAGLVDGEPGGARDLLGQLQGQAKCVIKKESFVAWHSLLA